MEIPSSAASMKHHRSPSHRTTPSTSSQNGNGLFSPAIEEPDPDAQLLAIIGHISSETTGALHKEGITELHHFLKAYPHKKPRVEKMLESTGAAFRKYINRALASRAAEDQERNVAVADTLSSACNSCHCPFQILKIFSQSWNRIIAQRRPSQRISRRDRQDNRGFLTKQVRTN
jgi:cytoskeleton-associated protein 5